MKNCEFSVGQIVSLRMDPAKHGAIVGIQDTGEENKYSVFLDGAVQMFYASQLRCLQENKPSSALTCEEFNACLTAFQIMHPGQSQLYSLNAARIDFIPYQFRPVLRFIHSDQPRILIADSVGVGKTIEAGLILRELQARTEIHSILIICPRPLVTECKWQREMKRFDESFVHIDGASLRYCLSEYDLEGEWPYKFQKCIIPYSLFDETLLLGSGKKRGKRIKGLLDLDPPPAFDLVIVDEAHHIRNPLTFSHNAVRFFCENAKAVVFLTATPIQLGEKDLFVLLNTLRPDLVVNESTFNQMAAPNPFINQAALAMRTQMENWQTVASRALEQAVATPWGKAVLETNPDYAKIQETLSKDNVSLEERVKMISRTEEMHSFAGMINRTLRRDIGEFTVRKSETVEVPFTESQQYVHDEVLRIQADIMSMLHGETNIKFLMSTIRRQTASCLYGLVPFLREILTKHLDELEQSEADNLSMPSLEFITDIRLQIEEIIEKAEALDDNDPKLDALCEVIERKQAERNHRIMVFSTFRHTLNYLFENLKKRGYRVGLVHGGTPDEDRVALRDRFQGEKSQSNSIDVMLFSEIGCEGLDYQFCDCLVNYDIPWNPMRIEQRIGRIDRNGQQSESIAIFNFITPGTVEAEIYMRCLIRIGIFERSLGVSEKILGDITREIKEIAENYRITEEERKTKLQQLADNKIRLIQEQEALEKQQIELFGFNFPKEILAQELSESESFWLSPQSLQRLIAVYLKKLDHKVQDFILGEKEVKTLRVSQEVREKLLQDFRLLPRQNTVVYRAWEKWLKESSPYLTITFESEAAKEHQEAVLLMPYHPLIRQAAHCLEHHDKISTQLVVHSNLVPAGEYEFAIYHWRYHGLKEDNFLKVVSSSEQLTENLLHLLCYASDNQYNNDNNIEIKIIDSLDNQHYKLWQDSIVQHREKTKELIKYRIEILHTSHMARVKYLTNFINRVNDEKIQRMKQAELNSAQDEYVRKLKEFKEIQNRADIIANPVAYGKIKILGDEKNDTEFR